MRILRILPCAFTLLLVACGGTTFPVDGTGKSKNIIITPSEATLPSRSVRQFTATVSGRYTPGVTWSTTAGTVSTTGLYQAPIVTTVTTALITAKTADDSTSTTITIRPLTLSLSSSIKVAISPAKVTLAPGARQQFTATVSGTTNDDVTWSATNGTVTAGGLFSAPGVGIVTSVSVDAISSADPTKSASASVTTLAQATQHSVDLNWDGSTSPSIVGYNVYRGQAVGGPFSKISTGGPVASTLFTDTSVTNGITYYYVATVVDSSGRESAHSNQARAVIPR
jgi:hypothetical protein